MTITEAKAIAEETLGATTETDRIYGAIAVYLERLCARRGIPAEERAETAGRIVALAEALGVEIEADPEGSLETLARRDASEEGDNA
jgi:hypothetical protein